MASKTPSNIIQINEGIVQSQLKEVVKDTVEETLNSMLDAEANRLCNAQRMLSPIVKQFSVPFKVEPAGIA